jgi:hypothetical protein
MTPAQAIAMLDRQLAENGENVILRRRSGEPPDDTYQAVTCRARVDAAETSASPAGIRLSELAIIMSPTQINQAAWPGGVGVSVSSPDQIDLRFPVENDTDDLVIRGKARVITFVDAKVMNGVLVRLNLRCES